MKKKQGSWSGDSQRVRHGSGEEVEVVDYESAQEIVLEMHIKKAFEDE